MRLCGRSGRAQGGGCTARALLAWQVASIAYAPSNVLSVKGISRKLPCTGLHSAVKPSCAPARPSSACAALAICLASRAHRHNIIACLQRQNLQAQQAYNCLGSCLPARAHTDAVRSLCPCLSHWPRKTQQSEGITSGCRAEALAKRTARAHRLVVVLAALDLVALALALAQALALVNQHGARAPPCCGTRRAGPGSR